MKNRQQHINELETSLEFERNCFNFLLATLPYAILHIDEKFFIRSANECARHVFGLKDKLPDNATMFDFLHMENKKQTQALFLKADADLISFHAQWRHINSANKYFMWDCLRRPLTNGDNGYLCIGKDITVDLAINIDNEHENIDFAQSLDEISKLYGNNL